MGNLQNASSFGAVLDGAENVNRDFLRLWAEALENANAHETAEFVRWAEKEGRFPAPIVGIGTGQLLGWLWCRAQRKWRKNAAALPARLYDRMVRSPGCVADGTTLRFLKRSDAYNALWLAFTSHLGLGLKLPTQPRPHQPSAI